MDGAVCGLCWSVDECEARSDLWGDGGLCSGSGGVCEWEFGDAFDFERDSGEWNVCLSDSVGGR